MADTYQQQTWSGVNDESERKTEKGGSGKVACPHYHLRYAFTMFLCALFMLLVGCNIKPKEKPLSLGSFTEISSPSISPDGNQILFTGCGHKEFPACTIYRYERDSNKLFRYMPRSSDEMLHGGRFSPTSNRFAFSIIPLDSSNEKIYDDTQVALVNQDGSGLLIITKSKGVKLNSAISYDEKSLRQNKGTGCL